MIGLFIQWHLRVGEYGVGLICSYWVLWFERNKQLFDRTTWHFQKVLISMKEFLCFWLRAFVECSAVGSYYIEIEWCLVYGFLCCIVSNVFPLLER